MGTLFTVTPCVEEHPSCDIPEQSPRRAHRCLTPVVADNTLTGNSVSDTFADGLSGQSSGGTAEHSPAEMPLPLG